MSTDSAAGASLPLDLSAPRRGPAWGRLWRLARRKPLATVSALVIVAVVVAAAFAPLLAPYDPYQVNRGQRLKPPSARFVLGTDDAARDILSRVIYGARISLWVGIVSVTAGTAAGAAVGLVSGFRQGAVDMVLQRIMDVLMSFPAILLAMALVAVLGPSVTNVILAVAVVTAPAAARVIRGSTLAVKQNVYIEAARTLGAGEGRILLRHILPNVTAPIIVIATVTIGNAILTEAALSFLGLGVQPPTPSWGSMLSGAGRTYFERAPWMALAPGLAITLVVFSFNMFGDAMRDALDPRLRGR